MILKTMNSNELFKEIEIDFQNVLKKHFYLLPKVTRKLKKSREKIISIIFDYKSPKKNEWIVCIQCSKKGHSMTAYCYVKGDMNFYMMNDTGKSIVHYTPHFAERYAERFLQNTSLSKTEIMKKYIINNTIRAFQDIDNKFFAKSEDGIEVGEIESINNGRSFFHAKTFLSFDLLKADQTNLSIQLNKVQEEYLKPLIEKYRF